MAYVFRVGSLVSSQKMCLCGTWKSPLSLLRPVQCRVVSTSSAPLAPQVPQAPPTEGFWEKNKRLGRPTSPHLTIYKFQVTSVMSVLHRATGIALSVLLSGFGIGMLLLPASYPYYIGVLTQAHYGPSLIFAAKFLLAAPFCYHTFNGVRHLTWDLGYGFSLRTLYKSGYGVATLALLTSLALASY